MPIWPYTPMKRFHGVYMLFLNGAEQIIANCNYVLKILTHNLAYNLNRNLLAISVLATKYYKYGVYRRATMLLSRHHFS